MTAGQLVNNVRQRPEYNQLTLTDCTVFRQAKQLPLTSSPAVIERLHDASCLSVASIVKYVKRNLV